MPDGIPLLQPWIGDEFGLPNGTGDIELVEMLADHPFHGVRLRSGMRFRVRLENFGRPRLRNRLWEGETPGGQAFRVLRSSPVSKQVALKQAAQSSLIKQMWNKLYPDNPLGEAAS
jgi:hypothetical protein